MSTPYVGLKQVFKAPRTSDQQGNTPWTVITPADPAVPQHTGDYRKEVKRRLIQVLATQFGVETIQVGALMMRLTDEVPSRHLMKATHYLIEQLRQEDQLSEQLETLEACLQTMIRS